MPTFVSKSEDSIRLLFVQAVRNSNLLHVRHLVQSASEARLPSRGICWLAWSVLPCMFSPQLKEHGVFLHIEVGFACVFPRDSKLLFLLISPTQPRYFSAIDPLFKPWSQPLSLFRHLLRKYLPLKCTFPDFFLQNSTNDLNLVRERLERLLSPNT